jgi:hypothetical protein
MEWFKKYGKTYWAKHLRKDSLWTKRMANSKSRLAVKRMMKRFLVNREPNDVH